MSNYRVLISCPLIHDAIDEYGDRFTELGIEYDVPDIDQRLDESELLEIIDRYDGVLAGDDEFTARVLGETDGLKVISKWGIGMDDIDLQVAEEEGIKVENTPGAFNDEVADVVIGYTVMLARRLHLIDGAVRDGEWYCPRGRTLFGKTFGVVGVGNIGSTVARRAHAHGMKVLGHDVEPLPDQLKENIDIESVSLEELFDKSSFVSLNCSLNEATQDIVGEEELELLGPEGYLINTARGGLVDEEALVRALETDELAGAALDVFREEPLPTDNPLTEMEDVILGSHNAQNTNEAVSTVNERAVENLVDGLLEER